MDNKYTQNSLKRKNHKSYQTQTNEKAKEQEKPKPDRVDTILDTVETENIAKMLRFILHEEEL